MSRFYTDNAGVVHGSSRDRRTAQRKDRDERARGHGWRSVNGPLPSKTALDALDADAAERSRASDDGVFSREKSPEKSAENRVKMAAIRNVAEIRVERAESIATEQRRVDATGFLDGERREARTKRRADGTSYVTTDGRPRRKCVACGKSTRRRMPVSGTPFCGCALSDEARARIAAMGGKL